MTKVKCVECQKLYNTIIELIEHFQQKHPAEFEAFLHYIFKR